MKSFSFDHSILEPPGIHLICDLMVWSPSIVASQVAWNISTCSGVHVSGALAKASGMLPWVKRSRKYAWNRRSVLALSSTLSSGAVP